MTTHEKIKPHHLARNAVIYVRQSTPGQVMSNRESSDRQYALADQARELGWRPNQIDTIDTDQGVSGSFAGEREGFARLQDEIAHGRVGAVFGLEVSRLARNSVEWFQLLDWCRTTDTLLVEGRQVYAPARHDDSLVLSIKGALSETETFLIVARMRGGLQNKAARGELYHMVPIGYVRDGASLRKDPDRQIQNAIEAVFSSFREQGSARRTTQALCDAGQKLPGWRRSGAEITWSEASYSRVMAILNNPLMGGAYVYGRQRTERVLDDNDRLRKVTRRVAREDWQVLIEDHHEGYVSWTEWLDIQERLSQNARRRGHSGAVREGKALLQGRVVCGHCGRSLQVGYGKGLSYHCPSRSDGSGRGGCMRVGGKRIDDLVAREVLEAASPSGVEAAARAFELQESREQEALRGLQLEVERCDYEASLAERRYRKIDPDNRLVADTLERDWETALRALAEARAVLDRARDRRPALPPLERLNELGKRLLDVWTAACVTPRDRKRLLACLVEEVMLSIDRETAEIQIILRWNGGRIDEHKLPLQQRTPAVPSDDVDTVELVRRLAEHYPDGRTAVVLNKQGRQTAQGKPFTAQRVARMRCRHRIPAHKRCVPDNEAPIMSITEAARELRTTEGTLYRWVREGLLPAEQMTPGAPYRIRMTEELSQRFSDEPPEGFVSLFAAMRLLGVSRQRIWQRIRDGELESRHIRHGPVKGLYVRLSEDPPPLLAKMGQEDE